MPVYPVEWVAVEKSGRYPHMFKHDIAIWERFLDAYGGQFDAACYDVALGGITTDAPDADPAMVKGWQYSTAKKIDAAVRNDVEVWLCEVRPDAGLAAVGSVLGYALLSESDPWTALPLVPVIVTDRMDGDTKLVCREFEILVIELPRQDATAADAAAPVLSSRALEALGVPDVAGPGPA
jgi:hypothetical protein